MLSWVSTINQRVAVKQLQISLMRILIKKTCATNKKASGYRKSNKLLHFLFRWALWDIVTFIYWLLDDTHTQVTKDLRRCIHRTLKNGRYGYAMHKERTPVSYSFVAFAMVIISLVTFLTFPSTFRRLRMSNFYHTTRRALHLLDCCWWVVNKQTNKKFFFAPDKKQKFSRTKLKTQLNSVLIKLIKYENKNERRVPVLKSGCFKCSCGLNVLVYH